MANAINSLKLGDGTYVFTTPYATCGTAAAEAAKVAATTPGSNFSLETGARVTVKFTVTNTAANPTLNVNNTGAKAIYYRGSAISAGYLAANRTYEFVYNGTQYDFIGDIDTNTDTNTNTSHSHDVGVGLVGSGNASTSGGTYTYKAKLKDETKNANDSLARPAANANRLYPVEVDKSGYLAVTVPWSDSDTDTKNTAGSTDTSSKIFLIGATSQAANPQTYSHDTVYIGTDGCLNVRSADSDNERMIVAGTSIKKVTPVGTYEYGFPSLASGNSATIALTSDIPDVSNFITSNVLNASLGNYVDLSSAQTISGKKTFTGGVQFGTGTVFNNGGIQIPAANAFSVMGMYNVSLPSKSGTIALTSDIPSGGGGGDVTLAGNNTFTGINAFSNTVSFTSSVIMTSICPAAGYGLTLPKKTGTLATLDDINDTKNTAGSTDTSSKIFLIGATSQAANPQTYSHDTVYVDSSGRLTNIFTNAAVGLQTTIRMEPANARLVVGSGAANADPALYTAYCSGSITYFNGTSYNLSFPAKAGTIALTSDIPIKTATLSGTTLSITLS